MQQYKLKNDIPVILEPMKGTDVVTALILFKVGSRNETKGINGISHFLEHLFFKGTENRPTTLDISRELDGVGADFNAFTSKEYTGYYVKVASKHTKLALDILQDMLFNPLFEQEEIDRERGVICEEINMYEDRPMAKAEIYSEELLFGANHPLGYDIAGPKEVINKVTRKQIMDYREAFYYPKNMRVVVAGNLPKDIRAIVKNTFGAHDVKNRKRPAQKKFEHKQRSARALVAKKQTAQSHLAVTFPGPTHNSKDAAVASVARVILGGSMSSRLFINVRERQGLCYYIRAGISAYEDVGAFTIQAGFDNTRIKQAIKSIATELKTFANEGVTADELKMAKEYIAGKTALRLEDTESVALRLADMSLFDREMKTVNQQLAEIKKVTAQQVQNYAKKLFQNKNVNLVVVGPYTKRQETTFKKLFDLS